MAQFSGAGCPADCPALDRSRCALSAMEVVNDPYWCGAACWEIPTLLSRDFRSLQVDGDPGGAALLSLIALSGSWLLLFRRSANLAPHRRLELAEGSKLSAHLANCVGWRALAAQLNHRPPPIATLTIRILCGRRRLQGMGNEPIPKDLLPLAGRSLGAWPFRPQLIHRVRGPCLLAIIRRWSPQNLVRQLSLVAGMGYAVPWQRARPWPMLFGGPLAIKPSDASDFWGYGCAFGSVQAGTGCGLGAAPPSIDESATSLGLLPGSACSGRIHLPL